MHAVVTTLIYIIGVTVMMAVMMFVSWSHIGRSWKIVKQWIHDNDMELIEVQRRFWRRGPYWYAGRGQDVFHVTVRNSSGQVQRGYVCLDLSSDQVDVKWDK